MNTFIIGLIIIGVSGIIALVLYAMFANLKRSLGQKTADNDSLLLLQNQLQELAKVVDQKLGDTHKALFETQNRLHKTLQDQFGENTKMINAITGNSTRMITQITEKLTSLDKTNQQVIGFSEQLRNLERVLTSQKQRGNLGEAGLKLVLENMLPPNVFKLQHGFENGDIVDALIVTKDGGIPVDAKFSLENYQRLVHEEDKDRRTALEKEFVTDLKKRIDETGKYIRPNEGTLDFAFMFIPSEAIYYDLLVNEVGAVTSATRNLITYAFKERHVMIVSPTTFAAYLQTVVMGLHSLKVEESAKDILKHVGQLQRHLKTYDEYMQKLGGSLGTTVGHFNNAYKEFGKIDKDIMHITDGERFVEPLALDRPQTEDV